MLLGDSCKPLFMIICNCTSLETTCVCMCGASTVILMYMDRSSSVSNIQWMMRMKMVKGAERNSNSSKLHVDLLWLTLACPCLVAVTVYPLYEMQNP